MKFWVSLCAVLAIGGSAVSIARAQTAPGEVGQEGAHGGGRGALRAACQADLDRFCPDVTAGGGRIMQCMREHQDELSDGCKAAAQAMREHRRRHDGALDAPPAAPSPPQG